MLWRFLVFVGFWIRFGFGVEMSHCSNEALMESEIKANGNETEESERWWSTALSLSLNETACFVVSQNRTQTMHSIKYARLEHRYPIADNYIFGIPSIRQNCKCDCAGGETICGIDEYHYNNCTSNSAICYRTFRPSQSNAGCLTSGKSELCCQIEIDPYRGWRFKALRLRQPDTFIVLHYRIYVRQSAKWKAEFRDDFVRIPINSGIAKIDGDNHSIRIAAASARPHRQVEPGMYFFEMTEKQLRGNVLLNEPSESSLDKLGWLRWDRDSWSIKRGLEKITQSQHVSVQNCKAQRYRFSFSAEQFVLSGNEAETLNYHLGNSTKSEKWVGNVEIGDRDVTILHSEGSELSLHIRTQSRVRIVRHNSEFSHFNGSIQLDAESNRFMNLSFFDVRGTLIGELFRDETSAAVEMMFSVQTSEHLESLFRSVVAVPSTVSSRRRVCIYPAGDQDAQQCLWLEYNAEPLRPATSMPYYWREGRTECKGCNERGLDGFLESLDPRRWLLDGLQTPTDFFVVGVEFLLCLGSLLFALLLLTKCVIPLCRCFLCLARPLNPSSSRKHLHLVEKF